MDFLLNKHQARDGILHVLAHSPSINISMLQSRLMSDCKMNVSQSTLYRLVSQMVTEKVIVRSKGNLSLNYCWLLSLESFARGARRTVHKVDAISQSIPTSEGDKRVISVMSLMELHAKWSMLMLALTKTVNDTNWSLYSSHPWQFAQHPFLSSACFDRLLKDRHAFQALYHAHPGLKDPQSLGLLQDSQFLLQSTDEHPFGETVYLLTTINDYVLTCDVPEAVSARLQPVFRGMSSLNDFNEDFVIDALTDKRELEIQIVKDGKRAKEVREKIGSYFG